MEKIGSKMENLYIEKTQYTPKIDFKTTGELVIEGKSYPENTFEFYQPVVEWVENYFNAPQPKTTLSMEIIYFNSSSSKLFFDLLDIFEENKEKSEITIFWIYDQENESAKEAGEDFVEDFESLNIVLRPKES